VSAGLPEALIGRIAGRLESHLTERRPGHCVRVDDLSVTDAHAVAEEVGRRTVELDVHVLANPTPAHRSEIGVDRAIELRNRKMRPLLLLVPAGAGHAASSLDNSFEPLPLITLLKEVSTVLEKELSATSVATLVSEVKHVLGRTRRVEQWARFLGAVTADPTGGTVGRQLWQVGLVPDLGKEGIETRLRRNAKAVAAISRPARPTARVIDRLVEADVKASPSRQDLQAFLEQQEAGVLADAVRWTHKVGEHHPGVLTFENWPLVEPQDVGLAQVKVAPFRRDDGSVDPRCKLRLGEDDQLYCDVAPEQSGSVVVNWATEPSKTSAVATWRVEVLPPPDLRAVDTLPIATMRVKGDKRRAALRVEVDADDLAMSTLFVVRVRALDADGNDLELQDKKPAAGESDQFEVRLGDQAPERSPRAAGASSLPEAVLKTAIDAGGDLTESAPVWDPVGQVFDLRIGGRGARIRVSRVVARLQRKMMEQPDAAVAFDAYSPLGEPIDPDAAQPRPLVIPAALADRRHKLLAAFASRSPRDVVEVLSWDDELRNQARGYVQSYRRALDSADPETRAALLAMDTLTVRVGTATDEVHGLVLLPTHPLRLAWVGAHDQLLRGWADEVAQAGKSKSDRARRIDFAMVSRLSPANMPFITVDHDGNPFIYAEELTYGCALYLPPALKEPQSASDVICGVIDVIRENTDLTVSSHALGDRIRSYRSAHPGTGTLRIMAVNPGSGGILRKALAPLVLGPEPDSEDAPAPYDPQRLEIIAYSDRLSYTDPVAHLRELQRSVTSAEVQRTATHLAPPLGLAARDLSRITQDHEGHHLAMVQDLAQTDVTDLAVETGLRTTAFRDLLTTLRSEQASDGSGTWYVTPALKPRGTGRLEADVVDAHRVHQGAVAARLGLRTPLPALTIHLDPETLQRLDAVHERADWVVTLDRGIGPELFDEAAQDDQGRNRYLLDYAPDFLEGFGKKLTVTTTHDGEVRRILGDAMRKLGIAEDKDSVSNVLNRLLLVSGRLALRLLRETSLSVEAVSLAAVMAHLERREQLDGRIVVPVDAHPEIFGARPGNGEEPARRCDILLVRVTQRSLRVECVEVKGRRAAQLPIALADDIVDQLEHTERVLQRQFFANDPPRLDVGLQRTRLAGLLHYYAERSARYGLIATERLAELHRNIDRIEESVEPPEITKTGYVISPEGAAGFPARHREVPIKVLTAADLGKAGFTTVGGTATSADQEEAATASGGFASSSAGDQPHDEPRADSPGKTLEDDANGPSDLGSAAREGAGHGASVVSVELGKDAGGTPVSWNVSTQGSPHAFILGIPGQGKSVTTRRIIREFADQGLPSLIMDFHGDMAAGPPGAQVIDAADGLQFSPFELPSTGMRSVNETAWEVSEIIGYVCGLGEIQRNHVYEGLRQAYAQADGAPTMAQFAEAVEQAERESRGRNARDRIRPLTDFGLFADDPAETFAASWSNGAVVDLSRLNLETVQLAAGAFILRKIYREMFRWEQADSLRLAVVLDEAHRLAKDVTLPKLMKEGRKYGISVVAASQGMADFHRDVLGNAGTKIIFRTNYPESKNTAGFLRGRDGQDLSQQIEQLAVGCAYVSTPDHVRARKVYMHR
jgi:DNA phosphorothioation-dependent restriction protein DptH